MQQKRGFEPRKWCSNHGILLNHLPTDDIAALIQTFWNRWSKEYVYQLQERTKWTKLSKNLTSNILVLLQNENLPPLQWSLWRVITVQPGKDGLVRTATIRTANGVFNRAILIKTQRIELRRFSRCLKCLKTKPSTTCYFFWLKRFTKSRHFNI